MSTIQDNRNRANANSRAVMLPNVTITASKINPSNANKAKANSKQQRGQNASAFFTHFFDSGFNTVGQIFANRNQNEMMYKNSYPTVYVLPIAPPTANQQLQKQQLLYKNNTGSNMSDVMNNTIDTVKTTVVPVLLFAGLAYGLYWLATTFGVFPKLKDKYKKYQQRKHEKLTVSV